MLLALKEKEEEINGDKYKLESMLLPTSWLLCLSP
jgi:hypothetical protein